MGKLATAVRDLAVASAIIVGVVLAIRFLGSGGGVSPEQTRTIDSLRTRNQTLDSLVVAVTIDALREKNRADSVARVGRLRARRDSTKLARTTDSLAALIPDTATTVPRPLHDAIVARKDSSIALFHVLYHEADSAAAVLRDSLSRMVPASLVTNFQRQTQALQRQINDLERKANRRWGVCASAGPGLQAVNGQVRFGSTANIGLCYRLR